MECNKVHNYLLDEESQTVCPFCNEQLEEIKSAIDNR